MDIVSTVDSLKDEIVNSLINICRIPAMSPKNGGKGELEKTKYIYELIRECGFDEIKWYNTTDSTDTIRPNLVAILKGLKEKTIWIVSHTDVVPPGDLTMWHTVPFNPVISDDKIFGRGVEDNGQSIVSSIYAVKTLIELNIVPTFNVGLAIVADEETGSEYGVKHLIKERVFKQSDLIIVPDWGTPGGESIEIAEKGILWLKISTQGKQVHGSTPEKGLNAFKVAARFCTILDKELYSRFDLKNELFRPPISTFEPTKKESNIPNINTIPGDDVYYMDCRILPEYSIDNVISNVIKTAETIEKETGAKIRIEIINRQEPSSTRAESEIVVKFQTVLKKVGITPQLVGIGGGTCAGIFRHAGFDAVVWATFTGSAHEPNEHVKIKNVLTDTKIYATLFS